jgi:hypothetical protein
LTLALESSQSSPSSSEVKKPSPSRSLPTEGSTQAERVTRRRIGVRVE